MESKHAQSLAEASSRTWLTVKDLAARFQVTPTCIWNWVKAERLPKPHHLGPQVRRWRLSEIEAFEARHRGETAA